MRKLLFTTIFLTLGIAGFAQDGSGGGTFKTEAALAQSGYAVITPDVGGNKLVVMETFGLKAPDTVSAAGFATPDLITAGTIFVDVAGRLDRNLALAMANPDPLDATITLSLFKDDGKYLGSRTFTLPSHNQFDKFITELLPVTSTGGQPGSLTEYTGTLSIISSVPISVLGLRFRNSQFSVIPVTNSGTSNPVPFFSADVGGPDAILLPQFAGGGGWATQLVITNPATYKSNFRVDLFKGDGTPLTATLNGITASSFTNLSVPPGGVLVLVPRDTNGDYRF